MSTAGMHGTEQCKQKRRAFRLSAPLWPLSAASGSMRLDSPQSLFRSGPVARNGLSLARNSHPLRGFHSGVNVSGLLLRSQQAASTARAALPLRTASGSSPARAASMLLARCGFRLLLHGMRFPSPLPFRTLTSFRIKAFNRCRRLPARLPNSPDLPSLPAADFYHL